MKKGTLRKKSTTIKSDEIYSDNLRLNASSIVTLEVLYRDVDNQSEFTKTFRYVSSYGFDDTAGMAKIIEQSRRLIPLNHPDYYYETIGRGGRKMIDEISRKIIEVRPGYPIAESQSDAERHGQVKRNDLGANPPTDEG